MSPLSAAPVESPPASAPLRRGRTTRWIALAGAVPLLALVWVLATRRPAATRVARSPLGKLAPAVSGQTIDGHNIQLATYRGR